MIKKIMNPVSWLIVFVFRVICAFPITLLIGLFISPILLVFLEYDKEDIYPMLIFYLIVSLVASIVTVLQTERI